MPTGSSECLPDRVSTVRPYIYDIKIVVHGVKTKNSSTLLTKRRGRPRVKTLLVEPCTARPAQETRPSLIKLSILTCLIYVDPTSTLEGLRPSLSQDTFSTLCERRSSTGSVLKIHNYFTVIHQPCIRYCRGIQLSNQEKTTTTWGQSAGSGKPTLPYRATPITTICYKQ